MTTPARQAAPAAPGLRWRQVYPGDLAQIRSLRRQVAALLPECPGRDDMIMVVSELAANAVRHTASGRGGWFAVEIARHPACARIAVADQGAPTGPQLTGDPAEEGGRGLQIVRALSARTGVTGGPQSRVVWAEVLWTGIDPQLVGHQGGPVDRNQGWACCTGCGQDSRSASRSLPGRESQERGEWR
jgi:anti-sigma regulatory factor (Ser/Thr protein kinase)